MKLKDFGGSKIANEIGCNNYRPVVGYQVNGYGNASPVYGGFTNDIYLIGIITVIFGFFLLFGIIGLFFEDKSGKTDDT